MDSGSSDCDPSSKRSPQFYSKSSLDGSKVKEVPNFSLFHVAFVLTCKDLDVICLQYRVLSEFTLEIASPDDWIVKPHPSRVGLCEESFKADLRLTLHPFIVDLLRLF